MSAAIDPAESLRRRLHPDWVKDGGAVSSVAFTNDEVSVDQASMRSIDETLSEYPSFGAGELVARAAIDLELHVDADPILGNPAHALIKGKKTRAKAKGLARACAIVRAPRG